MVLDSDVFVFLESTVLYDHNKCYFSYVASCRHYRKAGTVSSPDDQLGHVTSKDGFLLPQSANICSVRGKAGNGTRIETFRSYVGTAWYRPFLRATDPTSCILPSANAMSESILRQPLAEGHTPKLLSSSYAHPILDTGSPAVITRSYKVRSSPIHTDAAKTMNR